MIPVPSGVRVWLAGGVTDMRCGMNSLALKVQEGFGRDPHAGDLYVFRGHRGPSIIRCMAERSSPGLADRRSPRRMQDDSRIAGVCGCLDCRGCEPRP